MANTGGENVFPRTVEESIATIPGVAEVFVTKRDDPDTIQALVAYVVMREDEPTGKRLIAGVIDTTTEGYNIPVHMSAQGNAMVANTINESMNR